MGEKREVPSSITVSSDLPAELKSKVSDWGPPTFAAIVSLIPGLGALAAFVPNLRLERIAIYVANLEAQVSGLGAEIRAGTAPRRFQLFLEGGDAVLQAASSERVEQIARLVAEGVSKDEGYAERTRVLLSIIEELTDIEVALLLRVGPARSATGALDLDVPLLSACMARLMSRGLVRQSVVDHGQWGDNSGIDEDADYLEFRPSHYALTAFGAELITRIASPNALD